MNRLLSLKRELESHKSGKPTPESKGVAKEFTSGNGSQEIDITVDGDIFILEILDFFFHKTVEEKELADDLRNIAAKALWAATAMLRLKNKFPTPPGDEATVSWIMSDEVQKVFRKLRNNKGFYESVVPRIKAKYSSDFESALLAAKSAAAPETLTREMATLNTALVVFIENTGSLPFQWESSIGKVVQEGLEKIVDYISEEFEKWLNRFPEAKGKKYREVIILEDAKATYSNLKSTLYDLAEKGYVIDIFTLTHGNRSSFSGHNGTSISGSGIRNLRDDFGKPLPIRVVYMMNCKGSGLNDDWQYAGARAVAGSLNNNYIPEPMMTKVWNNWLRGDSFSTAVTTAYNDSVKLITDTIDKSNYIPFIGGGITSALKSKINPLLADSNPKIEGNGAVTIDTASLAAHALSLSESAYSEAKYGTGEHVLSGLVNASPVTPSYKIDVNGVKFTYAELIAMGDFYESHDQMIKAGKAELARLKTLIDKSKRFYDSKIKGSRSGVNTSDDEWQSATGGRYLKLAEDNFAHFAPSVSTFIPGYTSRKPDHKSEWEKYHRKAIEIMRAGNDSSVIDEALTVNAFGDHFLTDAFASGHLFNKDDLAQYFKSRVLDSSGKLNADGKKMFANIAKKAFKGQLKSDFSKHETVKYIEVLGIDVFRPNIHTAERFQKLLQGIMEQEPEIIGKTMVAKIVHDALNEYPGGIPVKNNKGDQWNLTGDGTLDKRNLEIMRKAVKQSIDNLTDAVNDSSPLSVFYKKVWDFIPQPTASSVTIIKNLIRNLTNPLGSEIVTKADELLQENYKDLLKELVRRKILKKA
jgi:hypothetical protein